MGRRPLAPPELLTGPFTVEEAIRAGLTRRQLQGSSWRRLATGIYVSSRLKETPLHLLSAVSRKLPPDAAFSGPTAAWLHGLNLSPGRPIEVTLPPGSSIRTTAGLLVRRSTLARADVVVRRGLRATSALRTLLDLARSLTLVEAVVAVDMALHRRLTVLGPLRSYADGRAGSRGMVRARRVLELAEPASESPMESRLRLLLVLAGLPRPEAQVTLRAADGRFLGRPDLYYRGQKLGLEYDGAIHRDALGADNRRQNRLLCVGIRLLRYTAADIYSTPEATVAQVRSALAA